MLTNPTRTKLSIFSSLVAIKTSRVPTHIFYRHFINPPAARFPISKVPGDVIAASSHVFKRKLDGTLREDGRGAGRGQQGPSSVAKDRNRVFLEISGISKPSLASGAQMISLYCLLILFLVSNRKGTFFFFFCIKSEKVEIERKKEERKGKKSTSIPNLKILYRIFVLF